MKVQKCIVQKPLEYNRSRLNRGQTLFSPGDSIFVAKEDIQRFSQRNKIKVTEEKEDFHFSENLEDIFPRRTKKIWVFGDGPTATAAKKLVSSEDVVFAVNHCFYFPLSLIPDYYVALDDGMIEKEREKIIELKSLRKFTNRTNQTARNLNLPEFRFFDVIAETGFAENLLEIYHGKTSCYCALQLAYQCGQEFGKDFEIHLAGIDLTTLEARDVDGKIKRLTHHYGQSASKEDLFPRMLASIRLGLFFLNQKGIRWINHSPLLASRIEDLRHVDS